MADTATERAGTVPDETALVELARGGDEEAYATLVRTHQNTVYGLALRVLRSPADAEDVAQESFVRAWLGLPAFRGDASFSTWLGSITVRRALDRAQRLRARRERETDVAAAESLPAPQGPDEETRRRGERLQALMPLLSPIQRAVVALYYEDGRPVREVAAMLLLPEGTVKTHLGRARATLRQAWQRQERER